ncbi:hypothetical protein FGB62_185g00 [Gracilaria domingensis]|nr:hypothetical protein FGB62_185g00 [Gracilaria domingensis]
MPSPAKSTEKMVRMYEKAIKRHNDSEAMIRLSSILCFHDNVPRDVSRGVQLLERAIKQRNNRHAMQCLAYYFTENGDEKQRRRVIPLLERAMRIEEDHWTLSFLSDVLFEGKCGESDAITAVQLHERALRFENTPKSMERLARKLLISPTLSAQKNRGLRLYKKAIRLSNDGKMMNELGFLYYEGTPNLPKCDKRAFKWFERGAKRGNEAAAWNMADMLTDRDVQLEKDPSRALKILQEVHQREPNVDYLIRQGDIHCEFQEVLDYSQAKKLYEEAILKFDSTEARKHLLNLLLGHRGLKVDFPGVVEFTLRDYKRTKNAYSLHHACSVLWNGAEDVQADPERALKLMEDHGHDLYGLQALMLRYDNGKYKRNIKLAQRLAQKVSDVDGQLIRAIILSEKNREEDIQAAEEMFRQVIADGSSKDDVSWTAISLRNCAIDLPFHGDRVCLTRTTKSFELIYDLGVLNLANLLLERSRKGRETGKEVVELLEGLLKSDVKIMAALNLVYVLWAGIGGVQRERARAMQLLEELVADTNDLSARAMLANALAEQDEARSEEIERSLDLWKEVKKEIACEQEVHFRMKRYVSDRTWKVWDEIEEMNKK